MRKFTLFGLIEIRITLLTEKAIISRHLQERGMISAITLHRARNGSSLSEAYCYVKGLEAELKNAKPH